MPNTEELAVRIDSNKGRLDNVEDTVGRLVITVHGDEGMQVEGIVARQRRMRETQEELQDMVRTLVNNRERDRALLKGMAIGLGLTGATSLGTLIISVLQALAGTP